MLKGSIPALVTPFKDYNIDYNALDLLLSFHLESNTDAILLLGTTAESVTLSADEKSELLKFAITRLKGKLPIVVGTGSSNVPQTLEATKLAEELGADYAMIVTPFYNKPNQEGLYLYYKELINQTGIKIMIYNVPSRTGCNISADTVIKLANEFPDRIVSIKEASGDLTKISKIIRDTPENFFLVSGEDALNYPIMCLGGTGAITVTGNVVPYEMHLMLKYALEKQYDKALAIHNQLIELNTAMFLDTSPIPAKSVLAELGLLNLEMRMPLCQTTPDKKQLIIETFRNFKKTFKS
jgi:4-hydroxy-tetrahydrodipicolinate synthase